MRLRPYFLAALVVLAGTASAQERNANACLAWTGNSLLANAYFQVATNACDYAIRIEYRYETDVGTGCFGPNSCNDILQPSEIRRFTAGAIRYWACRAPAVPRFPDITKDGSCE
jgi:hypothetical protein